MQVQRQQTSGEGETKGKWQIDQIIYPGILDPFLSPSTVNLLLARYSHHDGANTFPRQEQERIPHEVKLHRGRSEYLGRGDPDERLIEGKRNEPAEELKRDEGFGEREGGCEVAVAGGMALRDVAARRVMRDVDVGHGGGRGQSRSLADWRWTHAECWTGPCLTRPIARASV